MTTAPALPASTPAATCDGCDWLRRSIGGWCALHDIRSLPTDAACEYRRQLKDDDE